MKKRIFALGMSMAAAAALATSVSAATLPDQEFGEWWTSHSDGIELSSETTTITFKDVNKGSANWNNAIFVLYNGDEAKVNGEGYAEVAVFRLDNYGWSVDHGDTGDNYALFEESGFTFDGSANTCNWDTFVADTQAGVDVTVEATNTSMHVTSSNGIDYTATFPSSKYLSLGGELSAMSDVNYETGSVSDGDGDSAGSDASTGDDSTTGSDDANTGSDDANTGSDASAGGNDASDGNTANGSDTNNNTATGTGDAAATGNTATGSSAGLALAGLALAGAAVVVSKRR